MPTGPSRRQLLATLGATPLLAGCLQSGESPAPANEPVVDVAETRETDTDPDRWRDVSQIVLDGWVGGWVGREPDVIDRVENPTLVLVDGREYTLEWTNFDEVHHNFSLWDADREIVDDVSTPGTDEHGEGETVTFDATPEIATYRCEYQQAGQFGEVEVIDPL